MRSTGIIASAAFAAMFTLAGIDISPNSILSGADAAFAAGKGGGNGNGKGAGKGKGNSASAGNKSGAKENWGETTSSLGALNAAHASPRARERAAPNSRVGLIATYENAVKAAAANTEEATSSVLEGIAAALEAAANKPVNENTAAAVQGLLESKNK